MRTHICSRSTNIIDEIITIIDAIVEKTPGGNCRQCSTSIQHIERIRRS